MEWYTAGALMLGMVIGLMALGVPVALAFLTANIVGSLVFVGHLAGLLQMVDNSTSMLTRFALAPVPLFILMGALFFHSGLALRVFDTLDKLMGKLRGRLCYLTVLGGAMFSTLTGSSMANTAMLGSLMLPEMDRRGYNKRMSMGPILGTGGLAMIIPPSNLAVLLASIANIDVGQLLIAGLLPGIVLACLFSVMIFLQIKLNPAGAPAYEVPRLGWLEKGRAVVVNLLPMGLVVFMVIGFILLGISTPTEAAAFGVLGVLILTVAFRLLTWQVIRTSFESTIRVSGMVFFIIMNSAVFSELLSYSGASSGMLSWATGFSLPTVAMVLIMFITLLALGMFMDPVSMMLISVPIFFPLIHVLGVDPIWFGLLVLLALEMSGTTPPFGLLLFIMIGVAPKGTTLLEVASAAFPFLVCDTILIALMILFPQFVLWLPNLMH
ncbi:MAG TPA: TRAP transporter large permease [bacterium]|nr:TRAP transporter large permease [bacterium]